MKTKVTKEATNIIGSVSNIVLKAASILEENIAEGVLAAQKVEKKFLDPEKIRGDKDDLMNKFRTDTHQALDILFDTLSLATQKIQEYSTKIDELKEASEKKEEVAVPILTLDNSVSPGDEVLIPLTLENESKTEVMKVEFKGQELKSNDDKLINKKNISFEPKILSLKPEEKGVVNIKVYIPQSTVKGAFSGEIQAKNIPELRAILQFTVK
jgi:hypothetical protein